MGTAQHTLNLVKWQLLLPTAQSSFNVTFINRQTDRRTKKVFSITIFFHKTHTGEPILFNMESIYSSQGTKSNYFCYILTENDHTANEGKEKNWRLHLHTNSVFIHRMTLSLGSSRLTGQETNWSIHKCMLSINCYCLANKCINIKFISFKGSNIDWIGSSKGRLLKVSTGERRSFVMCPWYEGIKWNKHIRDNVSVALCLSKKSLNWQVWTDKTWAVPS